MRQVSSHAQPIEVNNGRFFPIILGLRVRPTQRQQSSQLDHALDMRHLCRCSILAEIDAEVAVGRPRSCCCGPHRESCLRKQTDDFARQFLLCRRQDFPDRLRKRLGLGAV